MAQTLDRSDAPLEAVTQRGSGVQRSFWKRPAWRVLRWVLLVYTGIIIVLLTLENSLIFIPTPFPGGFWDLQPAFVEDVHFPSEDGTTLHGWYAAHDDPRAVVLYAHGNAGNVTHRADMLQRLHQELGCTVLVFDYRGYGKSEGKPSEPGVLADARAAQAYLAKRAGIGQADVVLLGRSLGTGVAVDLALRNGARGLVLYSAFPSMPDVAAQYYPWIPVRWLMRTRLDSISKIGDYRGPLLQAHGEEDEVIAPKLGRQLFAAAVDARKTWLSLGDQTHNDPPPNTFYDELQRFLAALPPPGVM